MSPQLSLLVLRCCELEVSCDFYLALGLHFESERHGSGPLHYAAQIGELVLELYPFKSGQTEADTSTMLGFQVSSLEATLSRLDLDADIKSSHWGRFCNIQDPDGRTIRLTENKGSE